jgi:hypothetical protein
LYKLVDYNVFEWGCYESLKKSVIPEKIVKAAKEKHGKARGLELLESGAAGPEEDIDQLLVESLQPEHVIVDISRIHYGMGKDNPLSKVGFCSIKHNKYGESYLT